MYVTDLKKTYASYQSLWNYKKICNRNSNHTKRLNEDQSSNVVETNQKSSMYATDMNKLSPLIRHFGDIKGFVREILSTPND